MYSEITFKMLILSWIKCLSHKGVIASNGIVNTFQVLKASILVFTLNIILQKDMD